MRQLLRTAAIAATLTLLALSAFGQTAQISGTISDSTGARVPDAGLTVRNVDTGVERTVRSNPEGYYGLPLLQPGSYRLMVLKEGFKPVSRSGITLKVDENARIDFVMEVGEVSQTIRVEGETPVVTTDSGSLKQVIDQRRIVDLPLNGRNAGELVFLAAGTVRDTRTRGTYVYGSSIVPDTQTPAINGARSNGVAFRLDGANNNDNYTGVSNPFPNPDALQEFSVQTNGFSAEFGNAPGGVVNIRSKSGTNALHGTAFEFLRNGAVNARNFFAATTDNLKRNQFGGTIGGPVVKDKIFFFGSYQSTRVRATQGGLSQFVLTDAMRRGDFSQVSGRLIDPLTGVEFPGRQIPAARFDPVSVKLLEYMPRTADPTGRVFFSLPNKSNYDEYMVKSDQLWRKHQLYERFFQYDLDTPAIFPNPQILTQFTDGRGIRVQTLAVNDVMTISPNLLNSFTATYTHNRGGTKPAAPFGVADFGAKVAQPDVPALGVSLSGYASYATSQLARVTRENFEFTDSLTWIHGKHQVQLGGMLLRMRQDIFNDFRKNPSYTFTGDLTGSVPGNFLLGQATSFTQGGGEYKALRGWRVNAFVQDNYRATSTLTLNAGFRIDPWLPYTDELQRIMCGAPGAQSARYPNAPKGLLYAGDPGCPDGGTEKRLGIFAPRLGFAWSPRGSAVWSIRGGYGIFWEQPETVLYNRFVDNAPFSPTILLSAVQISDPYRGTTNPFPAKYGPRVPPPSELFDFPVLATTFGQGFIPQYMQNWNLTVERQIGRDTVARLAYAGSKGTHLRTNIESNLAIYAPGATVGNTQARRVDPLYSSLVKTLSGGNSTYNSVQATVEKRFARSFSFVANYTFSKSIDYSSSNTTQGSSDVPNPLRVNAYRALSDFDIPHRLVVSGVYALPELTSSKKLMRMIAGGWQISGIWNWQSGFPFTVTSGVDNSRSGIGQDRADFVGSGSPALDNSRAKQDVLNRYFNAAAFAPNALGTFGSAGRNILRGLPTVNLDASAQKYFVLTERVKLQFRAEFFNLTNTPAFALPASSLTSPSLGRILGAGDPRILQFGLKVVF